MHLRPFHTSYNVLKAATSSRVMMTSSILGKRSRTVQEANTTCQPRKRVTRRSTPQIFEDASLSPPSAIIDIKTGSSARSANVRASVQRRPNKHSSCVKSRDASNIDVQKENCPPTEVSFSTPSATRFKDVLKTTPETPKYRVRALGGLLTPTTPRSSDVTVTRQHNVYAQARQLFNQSAKPSKLVGRESERQQLRELIQTAKITRKGSCTYISGPPGTGKSALVNEALQEFENDTEVQVSVINCIGLRSAAQIYEKILHDFSPIASGKLSSETQLRKLFTSKTSSKSFVLVLDEVDSLVDVECVTLYNLFEWALHESSSLTLIGIANALDLTDRFLPRLKSKGLSPHLLPFLPYTAAQISQIITDKFRSLIPMGSSAPADFVPCMHPAAIQLCGKKIASQTGDLRKAFDLVRKAISQVEKDSVKDTQASPSKQTLMEIMNPALSTRSPQRAPTSFTPETAPRASIVHVARLASSIFNNGTTSRLVGLNLQQKAVLCSIVSKESRRQARDPFVTPSKGMNKAPTVGELFSKYTLLCKRDDGILQPLKDTEFRDVVASLETLGLVHESKSRAAGLLSPSSSSRNGKNSNERQIVTVVAERELRDSLSGPGADLLRRLLDEI